MASQIQPLPTDIVDQIAAGEVIDSLAAVVRELAENALDAQATRLTITLWPQLWRARVADNGVGMTYEDLEQAAMPHSTSKLCWQGNHWAVKTLGFRGEALHSLSQLAELEICSRSQLGTDSLGWRMRYAPQGTVVAAETVAIAPGTIVTVTDLFSHWPSRRQGLPGLSAQLRAVQQTVQQIALCHPNVTWQVEIADTETTANPPKLALTLFPGETPRQLLPQILRTVNSSDLREGQWTFTEKASDALQGHLYLLVGLPDRCHRRRPDWVRVAVNHRMVNLPAFEQAMMRAFRRTLPRDRYPVCFLHLQVAPDQIDWNRHPHKSSIYLRQAEQWAEQVQQHIDQMLRLDPQVLPDAYRQKGVVQLFKTAEAGQVYQATPPDDAPPLAASLGSPLPTLKAIAQVHQRYIAAEHPGGLCLIEQHIAHERVVYEQLSREWAIVPLASPVILEHLTEHQIEQLQRLSLPIEPFGEQLWAVRSAPAALAQRDDLPDALLELSQGGDLEAALVATACRTALRNGTPLTLEAMQQLLNQWQRTDNPLTCPHGRPICLTLEETSLARFFRRHWVIGKSHGIEPQ